MIEMLQDFIFVLACLTDDFSDSLSTKQPLQILQFLLFLGIAFNFVKGSIQKLMSIFLNMRFDRFSLRILYSQAEGSRIIILFLTPLQVYIHLLQLCKKIIDELHPIDNRLFLIGMQGKDQIVELSDHEKLLQNRVHITNAS